MKNILFLLLTALPLTSWAQSAFYNRNADDYFQVERFDILRGQASDGLHTAKGTVSRKEAVLFLKSYLAFAKENEIVLSERDKEEIQQIINKNWEWDADEDTGEGEYSLFDVFYKKRADVFSVQHPDYTIAVNPIVNYQQMIEFGNAKQNLFQNRKGVEVRANIKNKIGIYTSFTDNQERGPLYHQRRIQENEAVPNGPTYYKNFKPEKSGLATDYILANGYFDAEVIKDNLNISFGHDRFHLGDGYRSLFLSDLGSNALFFRINTQFWKLNYQNLFLELTPQFNRGPDILLPKKYAALHHLIMNVTKWLNVGLFEGVVYGRQNHFEFQYLNPLILYRYVEQSIGSPDNALMGINFKANPNIKALIYGQFLLDEFKFSEITAGNGWWANKYAYQLGTKIADPFGVNNLLVQIEYNRVRPFTYSYFNTTADYTHNNQPLAHPYGANFSELVLNINYKPHQKVYFNLEAFYNKQGRDSSSAVSFGGDIFKRYTNRNADYGINMYNGFVSNVLYANLHLAYEIKPNVFFDLGGGYRMESSDFNYNPGDRSAFVYSGVRWNTARRRYNY